MSEGDSSILEEFEICPMCGHEGITSGGRCANCGEELLEGIPIEPDEPEESRRPFWRLVCGPPTMLAFGTLSFASVVEASNNFGRDRTLYLLFATALGCVALIGLTIFIRGLVILARRNG